MSESNEQDWVIPPPEPGTVAFAFRPGADVELSPAAIEALETLARELGEEDVVGFQKSACGDVYEFCRLKNCQPMVVGPCLLYSSCRITG